MNPLPPNADELVSAYIDGEAAPDEIAVVESNADLMAQVEALRAISHDVGAVPPAPPALKEAHLAAALGAFDEMFSIDAAGGDATDPATDPLPGEASSPIAGVTPITSGDQQGSSARAATEPQSPATPSTAAPSAATGTKQPASLQQARERRQRRFSPSVIAASIAAVAFAVLLAFGLLAGSGGDDVATDTASSEAIEASSASDSADAATDAADDASDADDAAARAAPEAFIEPEAQSEALEESMGTAMADEDEAMEEEAMDEEAAMDDAVAEDDAMADLATEAAEAPAEPSSAELGAPDGFFLGSFDNQDLLAESLLTRDLPALVDQAANRGEGVFPSCQSTVDELAAVAPSTLAGEAFVADRVFEIHIIATGDTGPFDVFVVDIDGCAITNRILAG